MTFSTARLAPNFLQALAIAATAALVAACSGAVGPSPNVSDPAKITILPGTAVMYSGLPTTFSITGGSNAYVVTSDNQAVIPSPGSVLSNSLTLVPNNVSTDVSVTLTVRDTGALPPVTAVVTVRPGTVANNITITPNAQQSSSCNPAVCSGGDAEVRVTISQGGIPLAARGVRFEVLAGDFRFITTPVGSVPEQTATTVSVATDETGVARARIRATALAPSQTALLQVTDISSGSFRQTSFGIAQFTGNASAFFTLPSGVTFTGPFANVCASSGFADVTVFGGTPPYTITGGSSAFSVYTTPDTNPVRVGASGGKFTIALSGTAQCVTNLPIGVTDATGRTLTVTVSTAAGTGTAPAPPIALAPATLDLRCSLSIPPTTVSSSLTASGGTPPLSGGSNHPRISVTIAQRTVTVTRLAGDGATNYPTTALISVTDGSTTATATANVPANCP